MRVLFQGTDAIIIEPETEFESEWLHSFEIGEVFHKTGISASDYLGIKIKRKKVGPAEQGR